MLLAKGCSYVLDIPLFVAAARDGSPASASRLHKEAAAGEGYTLAPSSGETPETSISLRGMGRKSTGIWLLTIQLCYLNCTQTTSIKR